MPIMFFNEKTSPRMRIVTNGNLRSLQVFDVAGNEYHVKDAVINLGAKEAPTATITFYFPRIEYPYLEHSHIAIEEKS